MISSFFTRLASVLPGRTRSTIRAPDSGGCDSSNHGIQESFAQRGKDSTKRDQLHSEQA